MCYVADYWVGVQWQYMLKIECGYTSTPNVCLYDILSKEIT